MHVEILDKNDKILFFDRINDDDDFYLIEEKAEEFDCQVCIRWSRSSDGQVAFWSPRGASFRPHWYNSKKGRPEEMQGGKRRNVYIDDASWQKALELGNGNASDGIRIALARTDG